jgi:hypothetical protein
MQNLNDWSTLSIKLKDSLKNELSFENDEYHQMTAFYHADILTIFREPYNHLFPCSTLLQEHFQNTDPVNMNTRRFFVIFYLSTMSSPSTG